MVVNTKWWNVSLLSQEVGKLLAKNIERTARRQLDGGHLLFGEYYFAELNDPLSPKLAEKHAL